MMKKIVLLAIVFILSGPMDLLAFRDNRPAFKGHRSDAPATPLGPEMRSRLKLPIRLPTDSIRPGKPVYRIYPGQKPGHRRPRYGFPVSTTVVRETQPIIIVNNPPPEAPAPPPEPHKVWVPPVMDTRTEPGYWDYGIRKMWMGDHWRYEQDVGERTWVPASQVAYVKQEGYWKVVD